MSTIYPLIESAFVFRTSVNVICRFGAHSD